MAQPTNLVAYTDRVYDELESCLSCRVIILTTKLKTALFGKRTFYYNYDDEVIARATPAQRKIELTNKVDEETISELKSLLGVI